MKRILAIGGSRGIGLEAVRQGLEQGFTVRVFARSAEAIPLSGPSLEKRTGNALDGDDVAAALNGVDAVLLTLGVRPGPEMLVGPVRLFSAATRVVVSAMEGAGVKRLICVTGIGAGNSRSALGCFASVPFQIFLAPVYDDKGTQEHLIRRSTLDWVIARPVILTNGPKTGRYNVLVRPGEWRNGIISRADVADFLLRQVDDDTYLGTAPVLRSSLRSLVFGAAR